VTMKTFPFSRGHMLFIWKIFSTQIDPSTCRLDTNSRDSYLYNFLRRDSTTLKWRKEFVLRHCSLENEPFCTAL
jgi:hypothetical protein